VFRHNQLPSNRPDEQPLRNPHLALLVLTLISVFIALKSYQVAVDTLTDAKKSSEKQVEALDAARQALESLGRTTITQQNLLEQSTRSAATQVELLGRQQKRELEQADIQAVILYPKKPAILILNNGPRRVASDVLYNVALWNMSVGNDTTFGLLGAKSGKVDYILLNRGAGPTTLEFYPSVVEVQPKDGDRLFGYAMIQCPVCTKARVYWIYIVYGIDGVYAEGGDRDYPFVTFTKENGNAVVEGFRKRKDLKRIPARLE